MWQCGKPHQTAIEVAWWMDNETFLGEKNHKFGEPGGKKLSIFRLCLCEQYLVQAYILHVWTAQSRKSTAHDWIALFLRSVSSGSNASKSQLAVKGPFPVMTGIPHSLDGIAKTRALPSESSCYALKTSIYDHLSHLFISIHIVRYYKYHISLLYMSEGFIMCP